MRSFILFSGLLVSSSISSAFTLREAASLQGCLSKCNVPVKWETSPDYDKLAEPFNTRLAYKPVVIVLPTKPLHIQDAVVCAGTYGVKVQARSGGHSYASFSSGGKNGSMVINLQPLQEITLDKKTNIAKVGGGVRLGNLAQGIWDQGKRALPHGTCPGVGIGGHFTHGGYGHTSRHWGYALDTIVAADVVTANGKLIKASATENKDIFWAIRGAADSFGIVVNFYLQTQPAPESVTYFAFRYNNLFEGSKQAFVDTLLHIQDFAKNQTIIDDRISFGINLDGTNYNIGGTFFGTVDEFNTRIKPEFLRTLSMPKETIVQKYEWIPYLTLMSDKTDIREPLTGYDDHDDFFAKSITVPEANGLTAKSLGAFWDVIKGGAPTTWFTIINLYGGPGSKINNKDSNFAAYSERDSLWVLQLYGNKPGNASVPFINSLTNAIVSAEPTTDFGAYLNYVDPSLSADEAHELYYGEDLYKRLLALKKKVDPKNVFWNPQAIGA